MYMSSLLPCLCPGVFAHWMQPKIKSGTGKRQRRRQKQGRRLNTDVAIELDIVLVAWLW